MIGPVVDADGAVLKGAEISEGPIVISEIVDGNKNVSLTLDAGVVAESLMAGELVPAPPGDVMEVVTILVLELGIGLGLGVVVVDLVV